ncbi:DUF732 domain-containing protein [Nocardia sp. SYP-A9097]|uniref:DUF732 domain-containing protein n=1 Tax=Nocardia sp. SYP-A9097 TaxID=2663237 RepID=UPI001890B9D7|nr:DUF732 domain-containing protein [Nocardia sp. SYP-A9097]
MAITGSRSCPTIGIVLLFSKIATGLAAAAAAVLFAAPASALPSAELRPVAGPHNYGPLQDAHFGFLLIQRDGIQVLPDIISDFPGISEGGHAVCDLLADGLSKHSLAEFLSEEPGEFGSAMAFVNAAETAYCPG